MRLPPLDDMDGGNHTDRLVTSKHRGQRWILADPDSRSGDRNAASIIGLWRRHSAHHHRPLARSFSRPCTEMHGNELPCNSETHSRVPKAVQEMSSAVVTGPRRPVRSHRFPLRHAQQPQFKASQRCAMGSVHSWRSPGRSLRPTIAPPSARRPMEVGKSGADKASWRCSARRRQWIRLPPMSTQSSGLLRSSSTALSSTMSAASKNEPWSHPVFP